MLPTISLSEFVTLKRGYDLPARDRSAGPFPILGSFGVTGWHDTPKRAGPGVTIGRSGASFGVATFWDGPFWPLNTTLYVTDFHGNDPRFVFYVLRTIDFASYNSGSAQPSLNRNFLGGILVPHVPRDQQATVSGILGGIDDQIIKNRKRVKLLEQMAQAIYREWFVRFRYPGHAEVAFVSSPLGPIPAGWQVTTLRECASALVDGDWIETKDQGGSAYRLLQVSNIAVGGFRETGNYRYITSETFRRLRCTEIKIGDLLVSRMPDPVGRAWLVDHLAEPAITAVDVAILTPSSPAMGCYLNQVLNSQPQLANAAAVATGTTRKRITRSVLGQSPVLAPPLEQLEDFHRRSSPGAALACRLRLTNNALSSIRDLLLPRLVAGRIDVSKLDLDALVDSVA